MSAPAPTSAKPNFGPPMQDVRTEVAVQELENEYIAAKNSQPTHQHEVQAEAAKQAKEKEEQAKQKKAAKDQQPAAEEPEKANPEAAK